MCRPRRGPRRSRSRAGCAGRSQDIPGLADRAFGEAREAESTDVERWLAIDDQLGDEATGDGTHREAVATEARGEHEAGELRHLAEHGHEIGRGVDVAGPRLR